MSDTGSLQNLNDIVLPAPVAWWPPAPGWYVVAALLLLALAWLGWNRWRHWNRNRYRREALRLLARSRARARDDADAARAVPEVLKRSALSAWPRDEVAALTGARWHRFLDRSAGIDRFSAGAGDALDALAYGGEATPTTEETLALYDAAEDWLRRHRAPGGKA